MENEKNYLEYLAELYPTIEKAATEIINLQSVINLPKGTEHFLSDIHGEYEAFSHVLRNGSGAVRKKIDDVFGHTLGISEKRALATLIYYPRERLEMEKKQQEDIDDWYKVMLYRLIDVCKIGSGAWAYSSNILYAFTCREVASIDNTYFLCSTVDSGSSRLSSKSEAPRTSSLPWQS